MPLPTSIEDLSTTAASNSPTGSESPITADNYFRTHASFIAELRDGAKTLADYTALRAYTGVATSVRITGVLATAQPQGIAGQWIKDTTDTTSGCKFTGSITTTVLTVSAVTNGTLAVGQAINRGDTGATVAYITSLGTGAGGIGTYNLSASATVASMTMTSDNGGTYLVAANGTRWKRQFSAEFHAGWFGTVGDNVTDDTWAIQAAIYAASNAGDQTVILSAGNHKLTDSLVMRLNVGLRGVGRRSSWLIQHTNSKSCLSFARTQGIFTDISGIGFTVNTGVTGVTLLDIGSAAGIGGVGNFGITSCNFVGGAIGIEVDAGYYINLYGNYFSAQTSRGVSLIGDDGSNSDHIIGNWFSSITGDAVYIARDSSLATLQVTVQKNSFESITGNGINCPYTGVYDFSHNYFEAISGSEIIANGSANLTHINNYTSSGPVIVTFTTAPRGAFGVTPVTASGDLQVQIGGSILASSGNTQVDITNSEGSDQSWNALTTNLKARTVVGYPGDNRASQINLSHFETDIADNTATNVFVFSRTSAGAASTDYSSFAGELVIAAGLNFTGGYNENASIRIPFLVEAYVAGNLTLTLGTAISQISGNTGGTTTYTIAATAASTTSLTMTLTVDNNTRVLANNDIGLSITGMSAASNSAYLISVARG